SYVEPRSDPESVRPNILLIVVDDMGFSDLGSFGGEIRTPNLDALAYAGIRFSNFHTANTCSPTRSMLFTGVDSHRAGLGNMLEELAPNQKGQPGYEGHLNDRVVTLPTLMRDGGYRTYMTGKWHLGSGVGKGPAYQGFERSFSLNSGGASHYADMRPSYAPSPDIKADYAEDGVKLKALPDDFEYSTQYYVDQMIEYLADHGDSEDPFFAFLSFTAPHWPLQAPDDAVARHKGRYDDGYDALAKARLQRSKELGLVQSNAQVSSRSPKERPWDELNELEQRSEIRAMEIYAAMIDEVDRHTGRLFNFLDSAGLSENTIVLFMSDNGAEGHDLDETWPMEAFPAIRKTIDDSFDFSYESMGRPGSYVLYGPNWANAASPAFRLHKAFPTEGGTRVAAFIYDPRVAEKTSTIVDNFVHVIDVTPTLLNYAGIDHPGETYRDRPIEPMTGQSFADKLNDEASVSELPRVVSAELFGKRAVRSGPWKLVHMPEPYGVNDWQLFNVETDLAEFSDLAVEYPEKVKELLAHWEKYADDNNVIIPDWVSGY
ncbi:MAG: arylsulfatase, partial [Woeseiaceae bacterium]|nr:arylsulfatase [Woeseiaceae bacterium]